MHRQRDHQPSAAAKAAASRGFTLIELIITIAIVAILLTVGVPGFVDFVAAQRVRATASDLAADLAFARAEAIKESRRGIVEALGGAGGWKNGWRVCVDINSDGDCDAPGEVRKISGPVPGRTALCTSANVDSGVVFRPDGRAHYPPGPPTAMQPLTNADGFKVSDDLGDGAAGNDRVRMVLIGISGRTSVEATPVGGRAVCPTYP